MGETLSETLITADTRAREAALDPRRSILLQAPAGSGKTAVLTQRFLRLLCTVDEPGEILAITFTRKAAAQMRSRVISALRGEFAHDDPCAAALRTLAAAALAHAATRSWDLARDAGELRIQTIDSFNYWLATQLPLASRAGAALHVSETPLALYQRAARRTLGAADADAPLATAIELLFERLDNRWLKVERLLADMLAQRGHWLRYVLGHEPELLCARINESLAAVIGERLGHAHALLPRALRSALEALPGVGPLGREPQHLVAWQGLAGKTLTKQREWRKSLTAGRLGPEYASSTARAHLADCIGMLQTTAGALGLLRELVLLPPATLSTDDAQAVGALSRVLQHAAAQLQAEFALAGRVDYTYVTAAARESLGSRAEPTDLALRTGLSLRHILVDEFQDTSLAQFELLEVLTGGWEPGDGRTLFVVGDPMQSIYRFRDAEVGLFLAARERGVGEVKLEALRLTRNFRAPPALVSWSNEVFAQVFPPHDELRAGAVAYSASSPASARPAAGAGVLLRLFPEDSAGEARALAAHVQGLRRADPGTSVAVLVAAHAHATPIVSELTALGVESLGVDLVPLAERSVVRDLVQLARALYDLADRAAWLAVLRAPWCGARLATLTALSSAEDPQLIWEALHEPERLARCAPPERERLLRLREVLQWALERCERGPVADWLEATWLQLGAADAYARAELQDAQGFFDALAASAAAYEWRGPADFAALLQNLYSTPRAVLGNPVQIMTIHRAKGLEFDHVLVPALERSSGAAERPLLRWIDLPRADGRSDLLMSPAPSLAEEDAGDVDSLIGKLLSARGAHERTRLMYVAATRARHSLYLSAAPKRRRDGALKPDSRSLLAGVWPALAAHFESAPATQAPSEPPRSAALPLRRLVQPWRLAQLPAALQLQHLPLEHSSLEPPEFSWVGETQRHVGTVVHALLADAARRAPARDADARHAQVLEQLRLHGVPADERARAAQLVLQALGRTLEDPRGRWILDSSHREAHSELALTGVAAGRLRSVVIDRCFVDEAGTRWVIDYKSSRHEGGSLESFLEQEMQRYQGQLSGYVALARALGPQPVRAALYFPLLGAFRELT